MEVKASIIKQIDKGTIKIGDNNMFYKFIPNKELPKVLGPLISFKERLVVSSRKRDSKEAELLELLLYKRP
jgi:hypothetical protein